MEKPRSIFIELGEMKLFFVLSTILSIFLVISLANDARHGKTSLDPKRNAVYNPFADTLITAKAAYVYDVRTKEVLYAKNENARLPLASLTKVMSALVASDLTTPDTVVVISSDAVSSDGDSGLNVGERFIMKNLLDFALITSSNDGIRAAALHAGATVSEAMNQTPENAFIYEMNAKADELQMKNTYYFNETGLDIPGSQNNNETGGAYGSAKDMVTLFEFILSTHPELFEATEESTFVIDSLDKRHTAINTDILADLIPGLRASKTGFTDLAGGNLVIAFDPELNHPVIISVLGSTEKGRFDDMTLLINKTLERFSTDDHLVGK